MNQAITTRYRGPTYTGSAVYIAKCAGGRVSVTRDYELSVEQQHAMCAKALVNKMEWSGLWIAGGKPEGDGNVYICAGDPIGQSWLAPTVLPMGRFIDGCGKEGEDWFYVPEVPTED